MTMTEDSTEFKDIVSNAKVLDFFLMEEEEPSVILNYILLNIDEAVEFLRKSTQWKKVFSYDFIHRCNQKDAELLVKTLNALSNKLLAKEDVDYELGSIIDQYYKVLTFCRRQVLHPSSNLSVYLKNAFRRINTYYVNCKTSEIDAFIINNVNNGYSIGEAVSMLDQTLFLNLVENIHKTIFIFRLLQYDVFAQLSYPYKYILVKTISSQTAYQNTDANVRFAVARAASNLMLQILDSDETDDLKIALLCELGTIDPYVKRSRLCKYESFAEMLFETSINGDVIDEEEMRNIILLCIKYNNLDFLKEWIDYDREWFDSIISMSTAVEQLYMQRKAA